MEDVSKMKVADLKRELKNRNLSTIGNKTELMERLQLAGVEGDELLDESVLTDEEDANILDDEILQSPKAFKIDCEVKHDEDELLLSPHAVNPPKKVVLKRKNSFQGIEDTTTPKENAQPVVAEAKVLKMSERKPITISSEPTETKDQNAADAQSGNLKISKLTEKERLEMRAKKFGQTTASAITTQATTANKITGATVAGTNVSIEQIEKLKKRAERFGVVSPTIAKLDDAEKLLKRKERFGLNTNSGAVSAGTNDAYAEKARLRLERFKTSEPVTVAAAIEKK